MPYWQLFYHLIWSTKYRQPLLTPTIEPVIYGHLRNKALNLGAIVYAIGGVEDHVHMVVAIPPKLAVSKFVGQVKAVASTKFNKSDISDTPFFWQAEYGAFSFDKKRLPNYVAYVQNQKQRHANQSTIPILERVDEATPSVVQESASTYFIEERSWRHELLALTEQPDSSGAIS